MYYSQDTNDYDFNSYTFDEMIGRLSHFLKTQREHIVNLECEMNTLKSDKNINNISNNNINVNKDQ